MTQHIARCAKCGTDLARLALPDAAQLVSVLAGSVYAALAGLIPPDYPDKLLPALTFYCPQDCPLSHTRDTYASIEESDQAPRTAEAPHPAHGSDSEYRHGHGR